MSFVERSTPDHFCRIIDVGGGESTLIDDLSSKQRRVQKIHAASKAGKKVCQPSGHRRGERRRIALRKGEALRLFMQIIGAISRCLREAAFPRRANFAPVNAAASLTKNAERISKSKISGSANRIRTHNPLVDSGPQLAGGSASPAFGFVSSGAGRESTSVQR